MIAAVESVINQTEATEETKNLIRHQVTSLLMTHKPRETLTKVERHALRELKADKDIVIVPADKGRSTVVLDRTDYLQKAKNLLEDRKFYVPCETNPIKTLTREINATLLALENSGAITATDRRMARAQETALARFYGLPKVHKEGAPLRLIVSLKGTPTYGLARWLFRRLKFLTADSDTTVCSSTQFLEKLKGPCHLYVKEGQMIVQLFFHSKLDVGKDSIQQGLESLHIAPFDDDESFIDLSDPELRRVQAKDQPLGPLQNRFGNEPRKGEPISVPFLSRRPFR
nr:unnamed protein product [Spirometra erinaceieuropaei]